MAKWYYDKLAGMPVKSAVQWQAPWAFRQKNREEKREINKVYLLNPKSRMVINHQMEDTIRLVDGHWEVLRGGVGM